MLLRAYSILGTLLLALSVASPALAKGKKKATDDSAEAAADKSDDGADKSDKKADKKGAKKSKKKGKKDDQADEDKKGEDKTGEKAEGESEATGSSAASGEAETPNPDVWEKPPEDKEKPKPAEVKAPVVEKGDNRPWSAGLDAGWGLKTDRRTGGFGADPYGLTLGLRGGYEFDFRLYVGLWGNAYLGSTETGSAARINLSQKDTTARYFQFGADVGYDWWVASIIIRPSLGLGMALVVTDVTGVTKTIGDFMMAPGLVVLYPWDNLFVAGEMRGNIVTGDGVSALLLAAQFGFRFEQ